MPLLRFMELLGLATYEIRGGEKAEVFIRINDPEKLSDWQQAEDTPTGCCKIFKNIIATMRIF